MVWTFLRAKLSLKSCHCSVSKQTAEILEIADCRVSTREVTSVCECELFHCGRKHALLDFFFLLSAFNYHILSSSLGELHLSESVLLSLSLFLTHTNKTLPCTLTPRQPVHSWPADKAQLCNLTTIT